MKEEGSYIPTLKISLLMNQMVSLEYFPESAALIRLKFMKELFFFFFLFLFLFCICFLFLLPIRSCTAKSYPAPLKEDVFVYPSVVLPVKDSDPASANPVGVGAVDFGGDTVRVRVALKAFSEPVDIYFGIYAPALDTYVYLLSSENELVKLSQSVEPWREGVVEDTNAQPFGEIPISLLPEGIYTLYLLVTPAGRLNTYYLWQTSFEVPPEAPKVWDKWSLWEGGTRLRGANIFQRMVYPELDGPDFMGPGPLGPPFTQGDFDRLSAMGANYVNISHPGLYTETPPYRLNKAAQDNLDSLLKMIEKADMFAVISFRTGPGRSEFTFYVDEAGDWFDPTYLNDSLWQDKAAQDAWVEMWRYTAERYKDNPVVVGYDLMVEPNSNEVGSDAINHPLDIWDPETFYSLYGGTLYDWNQLYPRIIKAIREVDQATPVLVGCNGYSAVEWLPFMVPSGDARIVYTVHQYAPFSYTHQDRDSIRYSYPGLMDAKGDGSMEMVDRAWLENLLAEIDRFIVEGRGIVAANEYGVMRWVPGASEFMDDLMDLFEERGLNYAFWAWEPSWKEYVEEVDAFNFRFGSDPRNKADVANSSLQNVILKYWKRNNIRPSTVDW